MNVYENGHKKIRTKKGQPNKKQKKKIKNILERNEEKEIMISK